MGIVSFNKTVSPSSIECGGSARVTISLSAAPDILTNPADIVLLLDSSGSMEGIPLAQLKIAADKFVDILYESTGGTGDELGGGSRIAVVSFARTAEEKTPLTTSVSELKAAIQSLTSSGGTNHEAAFAKGGALLDFASASQKILIMFTDGKTTVGGSAVPVTENIKAGGGVIYCIGLQGITGLDTTALESWASTPASSFVSIAPDAAALETLFENLAANITKPGATHISITDTIAKDFAISRILFCNKGVSQILSKNTLHWEISSLGATQIEGASLEFEILHTGTVSGEQEVNESLLYTDAEKNQPVFPSPKINVDCSLPAAGEVCPAPQSLVMDGCQQTMSFDLDDVWLHSTGRLLELRLILKQICPGQKTALGVLLKEIDLCGRSYTRGFKALTVPEHHAPSCRDLIVGPIRFVLPEDLNPNPHCGNDCQKRRFTVQVFANAVDFLFSC